MDRSSDRWDPNATTLSIPVVTAPPRPRPVEAAVADRPAPVERSAALRRGGAVLRHLLARLAACTIDIAGLGFVVATFVVHAGARASLLVPANDAEGYASLAALSLAVSVIFALWCESVFGTTLGKSVFALEVVRCDGRRAGLGRVVLRYLLRPIDLVGIGPLLAAVMPRRQRLGDVIADTVVVRGRLGFLGVLLGSVVLAAILYVQYAFGGGTTSIARVAAETSDFAPGIVARLVRFVRP